MIRVPAPECKRCHAVLRFVEMATGSRMPVNPIPDPTGNVTARPVRFGASRVVYVDGRVLRAGETAPEGWPTFRPHFADCKDAPSQPTRTRSQSDFLF